MESGETEPTGSFSMVPANMSEVSNFSDYNNLTTTERPYEQYSNRPETYIIPFLFFIIFIVGILGNGTLVFVFLRHRNMRSVPNMYIFSLALGDLLVILTCVPFTSTIYTVESWPFGTLICKMSESAKDVSIGVSVFTLTALSADRYFAIVDPMRKLHTAGGGKRVTRFTIATALIIWIAAIIFAIPAAYNSYVRKFEVNSEVSFEVCYPFLDEKLHPWYARTMVIARFVIYYLIPLSIIGCFYTLMAHHLILSTVNMPGEMQGSLRQVKARKKVAKMVLIFVTVFAFCFFPQHVFMLWFYFNPNKEEDYNAFWHAFRIIGFCLGFINSCVNPIALYCVSGAFRKHFNMYLLCCCRRSSVVRVRMGTRGSHRRNSYSLTTSSRRHVSNLYASTRRNNFVTRTTYDSATMAHFPSNGSNRRRHQLNGHPDEETVTTFMNGGNGAAFRDTATTKNF